MIMLAKVVSYGGNSVRYATEKEKAQIVKVNHMPENLDATSIWYMMKHHCQLYEGDRVVGRKLERFMVTFVLSPSKEESENFTMNDWARVQHDALEALDSVDIVMENKKKKKKPQLPIKTNFKNSMNVGALHSDSKSGTLHLHIDCCRVDLNGKTNDAHDIHIRAMKAAEILNMKYGWEQPQEIRDMRQEEIRDYCIETLKLMKSFDKYTFFRMLRMKGYDVMPRLNSEGDVVAYSIGKNASVFKASEIGREFTLSRIETTWRKLHPRPIQERNSHSASSQSASPAPRQGISDGSSRQQTLSPVAARRLEIVQEMAKAEKTTFEINTGRSVEKVEIPKSVSDFFYTNAQIPEDNDTATKGNIIEVAVLLFARCIDAATSMSESCGGGGGQSPGTGWGREKDEDDLTFASRCMKMAHSMCKPKPRYRYHR